MDLLEVEGQFGRYGGRGRYVRIDGNICYSREGQKCYGDGGVNL